MYRLQDWAAVQKVYRQTHSKRETARILGISRNTVKKLLAMAEEPAYKKKRNLCNEILEFHSYFACDIFSKRLK